MSTLDIAHGVIRRGRRAVLQPGRIHADLPAAVAVVGVNGSGKSSLFLHLSDTLHAGRGDRTIRVAGRPASIATVPQLPALPAWLHVTRLSRAFGLEFAALAASMPGLLLHEFAHRRVHQLSLGQRQALAVALALGRGADVTLLDEPFSALDFRRRVAALQLMRDHVHGGRSILLSSQSAADLAGVCDHYVVIRDGRYIFNGPVAALGAAASLPHIEERLLELLG
jgi:ABC-2 type transport system ATP-binding protein